MGKPKFVSVILLTYNWPEAIEVIIESLQHQTNNNFELIITDDGSTKDTRELVNNWKNRSCIEIQYIRQEDKGFRASSARNNGTHLAKGDYLIYIDGDCIPRPNFIKNHIKLAEKGFFVTGSRAFLSKEYSKAILQKENQIWKYKLRDWYAMYRQKGCSRIHPLIQLNIFNWMRKLFPYSIISAKSCNFAAWKKDILDVNGWDQDFHGWGFEDTDLILRLNFNGIKRKDGRYFITILHLWHVHEDRTYKNINLKKIHDLQKNPRTRAIIGIEEQFEATVN